MVALELEYLFETGRTSEPARIVLQAQGRDIGLRLCNLPFADVRRTSLIAKDADIRAHYDRAAQGR